jgi:hypothetical protein
MLREGVREPTRRRWTLRIPGRMPIIGGRRRGQQLSRTHDGGLSVPPWGPISPTAGAAVVLERHSVASDTVWPAGNAFPTASNGHPAAMWRLRLRTNRGRVHRPRQQTVGLASRHQESARDAPASRR